MRRPHVHRSQRGRLDVKMTPMIDVVFLLLIFFICTASFRPPEETLPSKLAAAGSVENPLEIDPQDDFEDVVIKVHGGAGGVSWEVSGRPCRSLAEVRELLGALAAVGPGLPVILDAAAEASIGDVIDVYDLCRRLGFDRIQFAADEGV